MPPHPRVTARPWFAAVAVCLAVAGLALPSPATAVTSSTLATKIELSTAFDKGSGATCAITSTGESPPDTTATDTDMVKASLDSTSRTTNSGDPADVTNESATTRTSVRQSVAHGTLQAMDLTAHSTAKVTAGVASSPCAGATTVSNQVVGTFKVPTDGFVTLTSTIHGGSLVEVGVQDGHTGGLAAVLSGEGNSSATNRVFVTKGTADLVAIMAILLPNPTTTDPITRTAALSLHATFAAAGSGVARATGPGAAYLAFPAATTCSTGRLPLSLRAAAKNASAISLFVNGRLVKQVKHPRSGLRVRLALPPRKDAVVSVAVTRNHRILRGKRTYTACTL